MLRSVVLLTLLALPLAQPTAQSARTWIVDGDNRAGTDFTDINAAVQAVAPGDRLFVRRASQPYAANLVFQKGVTIEPEGGLVAFALGASFTIANIPAGQSFAWLGVPNPLAGPYPLTVTNCQGTVTLEGLRLFPTLTDAARVHLNHCSLPGRSNFGTAYLMQRSNVFLDGTDPGNNSRTLPRFDLISSTLYAQRAILTGQVDIGGPFGSNPAAALRLSSDSRAVLGHDVLLSGDSTYPAVEGTGELVLDPSVQVNANIDPMVRVVHREVVDLLDLDQDDAGARILGVRARPHTSHALVFGVPLSPPLPLPGLGELGLEPASILLVTYLNTDAQGVAQTALPLGAFFPRNYLVGWQALAVPPSGAWELSNPVLTYVR